MNVGDKVTFAEEPKAPYTVQHPLRVFEYILDVAEFDQRNRRVVIDDRALLANKLGEDFLQYIQNKGERS